jgi:hypothetical protein
MKSFSLDYQIVILIKVFKMEIFSGNENGKHRNRKIESCHYG